MGIMLRPRPGRPPISLEELGNTLRSEGFLVETIRDQRFKRDMIEQLLLVYGEYIGREELNDDEMESLDRFVRDYEHGARVRVWNPEDGGTCAEIWFSSGEAMFIGECFPGDGDPLSVLVGQMALAIGYLAEGE